MGKGTKKRRNKRIRPANYHSPHLNYFMRDALFPSRTAAIRARAAYLSMVIFCKSYMEPL